MEEAGRPRARARSRRPSPAPTPRAPSCLPRRRVPAPGRRRLSDIRSPRNPASIGFSAVVRFGIDEVVTREYCVRRIRCCRVVHLGHRDVVAARGLAIAVRAVVERDPETSPVCGHAAPRLPLGCLAEARSRSWSDDPRLAPRLAFVGRDRIEDVVVARRGGRHRRSGAALVRVVPEVGPDDIEVARSRRPSSRQTTTRTSDTRSAGGTGARSGSRPHSDPTGSPPMRSETITGSVQASCLRAVLVGRALDHQDLPTAFYDVVVGERDVDRPVRPDDRMRRLVVVALEGADALGLAADLDRLRPAHAAVLGLTEHDREDLADAVFLLRPDPRPGHVDPVVLRARRRARPPR